MVSFCLGQDEEIWVSGINEMNSFCVLAEDALQFMGIVCQLYSLFGVWLDLLELILEIVKVLSML